MAKRGTIIDKKDGEQVLPHSVFSAIHNDLDPRETLDLFFQRLVKYFRGLIGRKQDTLVSGQNIKTINGQSLIGPGNITIKGADIDHDLLFGAVTDIYVDTYDADVVTIALDRNNSEGNTTGTYFDIESATERHAGVMSAEHVMKLNELSLGVVYPKLKQREYDELLEGHSIVNRFYTIYDDEDDSKLRRIYLGETMIFEAKPDMEITSAFPFVFPFVLS